MDERRTFPRGKGDLEWLFVVQINHENEKVVTETKDISCSGIRCKTDGFFEKGITVELMILLPLTDKGLIFEKIKCEARSVRCALWIEKERESYDTAFEFVSLPDEHKEKISQYVEHAEALV